MKTMSGKTQAQTGLDAVLAMEEGQKASVHGIVHTLRDLGDAAAVAALCPGRSPHPDLAQAVRDVSRRIPYEQHAACAPIDFIHAHALCGR